MVEAAEMLTRVAESDRAAVLRALILELAPRPEDYARVFLPEVAATARAAYEELWREPDLWPIEHGHSVLRVSVASVEDLRHGTGRACDFPGGYDDITDALQPDHLWVSWELLEDGQDIGLAFDGLVQIDGRWAWFPKPWRILPSRAATLASHWID